MASPYSVESTSFTPHRNDKPGPVAPRIIPAVPLQPAVVAQSNRPLTPEHSNEKIDDSVGKLHKHMRPEMELGTPEPHDVLTPDSTPSTADALEKGQSQSMMRPGRSGQVRAEENTGGTFSKKSRVSNPLSRPDSFCLQGPNDGNNPTYEQTTARLSHAMPKSIPYNFPRELPPPFYPSENISTPVSSTSSSGPPKNSQPNPAGMHHPRPNANGIVFGSFPKSPNSSPTPPAAGAMPYHLHPPPPPGYVPSTYPIPPFVSSNHNHNPSDPNGGLLFSPVGVPYHSPQSYRREQSQPPLSASSQPFYPSDLSFQYRMPPPDVLPPRQGPGHANGAAESPQSPQHNSGKREYDPARLASDFPRLTHPLNGLMSAPMSGPDEDLRVLRSYLNQQFGKEQFADFILEVSLKDSADSKMKLPVHGVIISRSPSLHEHINRATKGNEIVVELEGDFVDIFLFAEAVKYLYGAPLLTSYDFLRGLQPFDPQTGGSADTGKPATDQMQQALAYVTSGHFLRVPAVAERGVDIVRDILRWDNVEVALSFALSQEIKAEPPLANGHGTHKKGESADRLQSSQAALNALKQKVLGDIIDFLATHVNKDFEMIQSAPQLSRNQRLPSPINSRASRHSTRLSQIRFGELPVDKPAASTYANNLISSILLSLPFRTLRSLFEYQVLGHRLGWPRVVEILGFVIDERESRRKKLLNVKLGQQKSTSATNQQLWDNVYWEEILKPSEQNGIGFVLVRERREEPTK